jgi:hypothetical protein
MAQANAIIVRIRSDAAEEFERLFEAEELPIWDGFVSEGTFLKARLARVEYGFGAFLEKACELQPESPSVFGGNVIFERG